MPCFCVPYPNGPHLFVMTTVTLNHDSIPRIATLRRPIGIVHSEAVIANQFGRQYEKSILEWIQICDF